jgi:hypothetical protein
MAEETMGVGLGDALQMATRNGNGDGWGGGAWWIIVLFLFMFGNGWNRNTNGQPVTEAGLCDAMNFNNLENAVGRLSDQEDLHMMQLSQGLSSVGYESLRNFADTQAAVKDGGYALSRQMADCCCTTQRAIDAVNANVNEKFAAIEKGQLQQTIAAQQNQLNQLFMQQQLCGVVRYPNQTAYNAGANPFFGQACCGAGYGF